MNNVKFIIILDINMDGFYDDWINVWEMVKYLNINGLYINGIFVVKIFFIVWYIKFIFERNSDFNVYKIYIMRF